MDRPGPLAEQQFLVETINRLQQTQRWNEMAILVTYDDSDGWCDPRDATDCEPVAPEVTGDRLTH
jgi:phospholipase C